MAGMAHPENLIDPVRMVDPIVVDNKFESQGRPLTNNKTYNHYPNRKAGTQQRKR
jgi:hypothetical protein